jgi:hypothetical protein
LSSWTDQKAQLDTRARTSQNYATPKRPGGP